MNSARRPFQVRSATILLTFVFVLLSYQSVSATHTIAGTIYDKSRNILSDIDVELQDEYYRGVPGQRMRTSSTGRYEFTVQNAGRYFVKVYAFRYDLVDDTQEVIVTSISADPNSQGSSFNNQDFYLQPKRGGLAESELAVVYAQEVPKEAKKLYATAQDQFAKKKPADGIMTLVEATKVFPDYYQAIQRLTRELFVMGKFVESFQYARRSVEVNPKSGMGFYFMGASLRHLGKEYNKAAIAALNEAAKLAPASQQVLFLLGKTEREQGDLIAAEKHLLAAKKVSVEKSPEVHIELSQLYANDLKKYAEAADELEQYGKASKMSDEDQKKLKEKVADLRSKAKNTTAN